jgi:hypothetical protein
MSLEKALDLGKAIKTQSQEKEKKSYLRQLCERLHLDSTKDYSKEEISQLEPSNRKRKFLVEKIAHYERSIRQKCDEANNKRAEEMNNLKQPRNDPRSRLKYIAPLHNISARIHIIDHMILDKLKYIQNVRLTNNEAAKNFLLLNVKPFDKPSLEKLVNQRNKLMQEYKTELEKCRKEQE